MSKNVQEPIVLTVHTSVDRPVGNIIRISNEAQRALQELVAETGLSVRAIASSLIIQAAKQVQIKEV